jgi:hypothetical protein
MKNWFTTLLVAAGLLATSAQAQNVGIGTNSPTQKLDVNGTLRVRSLTGTDKRLIEANPDGTMTTSSSLPSVTVLSTPPNLGSVPVTSPQGVAVQGNYLYVSQQGPNQIRVYDISVPTTLTAVGTPVTGGSGLDLITVSGSYLYACDISANTIRVYTTTGAGTPTNPAFVTTVGTSGGGPNGVVVVGSSLYIASYSGDHIERFDISNPALPVTQGTTAAGDGVAGLTALNGYLYAANYNAGTLQTFSIGGTGTLTSVNVQTVGTQPNAVSTANGLLYLTNSGNNNLQTFSLSTPSVPASQGTVPTGGRPYGFAVKGNYAYISNTTSNTVEVRQLTLSNALGFDSNGNLASIPSTALGDNLGTHTATTNLNLNSNLLVGGSLGSPGTVGIFINPAGQVGVNNIIPAYTFDVTGTSNITGAAASTTIGTATQFRLARPTVSGTKWGNTFELALGSYATTINSQSRLDFNLNNGASTATDMTAMSLLANGNVGLGSTSPLARLELQNGANAAATGNPAQLTFAYSTGGLRHFIRSRHANVNTGPDNTLDFYLNNSGGNVSASPGTGNIHVLTLENLLGAPRLGIGVTAPTATLDVNGTSKLGTNGTSFAAIIRAAVTQTVGAIPANSSVTATFTVANAVAGGTATISPGTDLADGISISYARTATGQVIAKFYNSTAGPITVNSDTYNITVIQ